jgi:hypothetical protein
MQVFLDVSSIACAKGTSETMFLDLGVSQHLHMPHSSCSLPGPAWAAAAYANP